MLNSIVSIVVPVYNVEKFLDRCVNSLVNQTYRNLEIILVDDGSLDSCPQMCDRWKEKDKRIKVVHKQNEGLGFARNSGMEVAVGKYVCFCDSDDSIDLDAVEKLVRFADENNLDMTHYGYKLMNQKGEIISNVLPAVEKNVFSGLEVQEDMLPALIGIDHRNGKRIGINLSACMCMYRMQLIKDCNWGFVSEREYISEDFYSNFYLYRHVKRAGYIKESFYNYYINDSSLTHTFREDRFEKVKYLYDAEINATKELKYNKVIIQGWGYIYLCNVFNIFRMIIQSRLKCREKISKIRDIVLDKHFQNVIVSIDTKYYKPIWKIFVNLCLAKSYISVCFMLYMRYR